MELELMHPEIIVYSLIVSFVLLLFWRKKRKYKKGVIVANSSYLKKSKYYKNMLIKYRIYNILIKATCILLIFSCAVLSARLHHEDKFEETQDNRDIVLCMDVSGSVFSLNSEVSRSLQNIVSSLKDERFGITVFNSSAIQLVPLTSDYNYATQTLKNLEKMFNVSGNTYGSIYRQESTKTGDTSYDSTKILVQNGTEQGSGASLIGDGLASCALSFKSDPERTKILILTTDNEVWGNQIISVPDAAKFCKENDIKIYPIGTKGIAKNNKQGLVDAANVSNGKYFDFANLSTDQIVKEIESLNKTSIVTKSYVMGKDFPELIFTYLLFITAALFILDWRVRI